MYGRKEHVLTACGNCKASLSSIASAAYILSLASNSIFSRAVEVRSNLVPC